MSRPRSAPARGASAAAGRAAGGRPGVFVQTPRSDIYVALLGIALGAMVIGCILLALVLKRYEFSVKAAWINAPASTPAPAPGLEITPPRLVVS